MANETKKRLLLSKWHGDQIEGAEDRALTAERDWQIDELESVLSDVRYWLHDGLVLHKIVSDPRALLRKVEGVLG